ncbi:MAG TPA: class I SAM-dependent methyltransferase [Gammaproteobacteria bacterium]|nr:class I SAM-dependent methyltransferase [Gammaproteobacteria bacterium]
MPNTKKSIPAELPWQHESVLSIEKKVRQAISRSLIRLGDWVTLKAQRISPHKFRRYQPLPWIGITTRKRDTSTLQRCETIEKHIGIDSGTVMDIGCNLGYFVLRLAEKGFFSIGIDTAPENVMVAQYAQRKARIDNAAFCYMTVYPDNINTLPDVDVMIFFSVWHHWIEDFGHDVATEMLAILWSKTRHVMFFETGEDKEIQQLGIREAPGLWARNALEKTCIEGRVEVIGESGRGEHKRGDQRRTLFAIYR